MHHGDGVLTIEIRTGKARQDTDRAIKRTKDASVQTGKALQSAGKKLENMGGEGGRTSADKPADTPTNDPASAGSPAEGNSQTQSERTTNDHDVKD
jgi:hypothetical protein